MDDPAEREYLREYLIVELGRSRYGIDAAIAQELFFLPALTVIAELPPTIAGVINLRGDLLPVLNLRRLLGHEPQPLSVRDSVVMIQWQTHRVGLIVNQVCDVQPIAPEAIQWGITPEAASSRAGDSAPAALSVVAGIAHVEGAIATLLSPEGLIQAGLAPLPSASTFPVPTLEAWAEVSEGDRQRLTERAQNLMQPITVQETRGMMPLAIVGLGHEYLGIELSAIHEFTDVQTITPIPCCPDYILGNINLRGEIVTLVDVGPVIDVPAASDGLRPKAIVIRHDDIVAGIAVDDIYDVTYIDPARLTAAPIAGHTERDDYVQGIATCGDRMVSVIDLQKILTSGALTVDDEV